ncbi:PPE domain-containing protein [Saccharothrix coeruleofusca]|uniref:PPE domain-containing protein n=1 Tax=Saccharothrix coeruleofusca TaxID=33919 RepID=A0A918AIU4_9PSEU|nr:PPE domain-containing protein [Saccharothrix coeruleofusca]GGP43607.1 hypothetical protein GCM10010185_14080 [Saccharothrix coeruleofusca]
MAPGNVDMDFGGFALLQVGIGAEKIYGWFREGKGPGQTTDAGQRNWGNLASSHAEIADLINRAVRDSGAVWEGAAGDQARASTSPLASWSDAAASSATVAADRTSALGEAFRRAYNEVEKPVDVPDKPWYNSVVPWDTDYDDAVEKSQQVNSRNMQVLSTYGSAANSASAGLPRFQSPDEVGAGIDDGSTPPPPIVPPRHGRYEVDRPGGGDDRSGNSGDRIGGSTDKSWTDQSMPPPSDDGTTRRSGVVPERPVAPPLQVDPPRSDVPQRPNDQRTWGPVVPPFGLKDPRNPNDRSGVPRMPGPSGRGGGGGGMGGGGRGAGGLGGMPRLPGMGGPGMPGSGMGTGMPPGGTAGHGESAGRGGTGFGPGGAAAGRGGPGGMGAGGMGAGGVGAGAGRGQGDEDKEHKSASYLQETEDIFGDGTMVAPPVIGE